MPSPTSNEELLDLVQKSGVVDEKRLTAYMDRLREAITVPATPQQLAEQLVRDGVLTHFQAEQFLQGKWRRFTIGKYKVLERLGSGGMGSVYLCEHKFMRRRVAVKVLPTAKAERPVLAGTLLPRGPRRRPPSTIPTSSAPTTSTRTRSSTSWSWSTWMAPACRRSSRGPGRWTCCAPLITCGRRLSACSTPTKRPAWSTATSSPATSSSIATASCKILDMGLARFFHDEEDILTKKYDENVLGTADYLAPEQALDSHAVDIRADIYSLGATFYFCLTGRTPFAEGTVAQKLIWHQTRQPKAVRTIRPDVPEELVAILEKMMAKDPSQRYQTPMAVAEALAPWTQTPIPPPPEKEMPQLSLAAPGTGPTPDSGSGSGSRPTANGERSPTPRKQWQVGSTSGTLPVVTPSEPISDVKRPAPASAPPATAPVTKGPPPLPPNPPVRPSMSPAPRRSQPAVQPSPTIVIPRKPPTMPEIVMRAGDDTPPSGMAPETVVPISRPKVPAVPRHPSSPRKRVKKTQQDYLVWWLLGSGLASLVIVGLLVWWLVTLFR